MKLYGLYLEQDLGVAAKAAASAEGPDKPSDEMDRGKSEKAKKQVEGIANELRRSLRGTMESLARLPAMETRTESRANLEELIEFLKGLRDSFDEGGSYFDVVLSAIMAGGRTMEGA
jgi:hypothetical protein